MVSSCLHMACGAGDCDRCVLCGAIPVFRGLRWPGPPFGTCSLHLGRAGDWRKPAAALVESHATLWRSVAGAKVAHCMWPNATRRARCGAWLVNPEPERGLTKCKRCVKSLELDGARR